MDVLMYSYIHAYVYFTKICDLLLFLIAEWSQFLVTIFIQLLSFCQILFSRTYGKKHISYPIYYVVIMIDQIYSWQHVWLV